MAFFWIVIFYFKEIWPFEDLLYACSERKNVSTLLDWFEVLTMFKLNIFWPKTCTSMLLVPHMLVYKTVSVFKRLRTMGQEGMSTIIGKQTVNCYHWTIYSIIKQCFIWTLLARILKKFLVFSLLVFLLSDYERETLEKWLELLINRWFTIYLYRLYFKL